MIYKAYSLELPYFHRIMSLCPQHINNLWQEIEVERKDEEMIVIRPLTYSAYCYISFSLDYGKNKQ